MDNGDNGTYFGLNLTRAVKNGQVSEERITNMVTRIIASWYKVSPPFLHSRMFNYLSI
jgi:beta-glucosidase